MSGTVNQVCIIPARMGSSRFPGKPLAEILGKPMINWVASAALSAKCFDEVYVATCDREIVDYLNTVGIPAILTSPNHERCTDRTFEAVHYLGFTDDSGVEITMLQGDEPTITSANLQSLSQARTKDDSGLERVLNLSGPVAAGDLQNEDIVKMLVNANDRVLSFARQAPEISGYQQLIRRQVCAMKFSIVALQKFANLQQSRWERSLSIDFFRFIENEIPVFGVAIDNHTHPVDRMSDISIVEEILSK